MKNDNKRGSIFIEASIVMPLALIISINMLLMAMFFYQNICEQTRRHKEELRQFSYVLQMEYIRNYERFSE